MRKVVQHSCLLFVAGILSLTRAQGQTQSITPVTPEAAQFAKMANYPLSMNTGVPNIGIPFYTIDVGGMMMKLAMRSGWDHNLGTRTDKNGNQKPVPTENPKDVPKELQ